MNNPKFMHVDDDDAYVIIITANNCVPNKFTCVQCTLFLFGFDSSVEVYVYIRI